MRIVFVGTVLSSYHALEELLQNGANVVAVFTLDAKYAKNVSDYKELDNLCQRYNIPIHKFRKINSVDQIECIRFYNPDYLFVIGLSQLITKELLSIPRKGAIGAHPSLLPIGRGRASIPWTILNNEKVSGLTLFFLNEEVDSGDIISQQTISVDQRETAMTLYQKVIRSLRHQIADLVPSLNAGNVKGVPQDESIATYTAKRTPSDGIINWEKSTEEIDRLIRATSKPYPGAFTFYKNERLIIWKAEPIKSNQYIGKPGQIVKVIKNSDVLVKTSDGLLNIKEVGYKGKDHKGSEILNREGDMLGINLEEKMYELAEKVQLLENKLSNKESN